MSLDNAAILELMKPKPCPVQMICIGNGRDGSYLLPDDLRGITACFSPGVNNYKHFEDHLSLKYGIRCHMCDYTSDEHLFKTPLLQELQTFDKKWLDITGDSNSIALNQWLEAYAPNKHEDLILQMDIEGAEFRNLLHTDLDTMQRFRIIALELHGLRAFTNTSSASKQIAPLLQRINQTHICVHAHPNNYRGDFIEPSTGMNIPYAIELTFLRKDRFEYYSGQPLLNPIIPHPLDIPRNVVGQPPIHLNKHWSYSGEHSLASEIKILEDEIDFRNHRIARLKSQMRSIA